MSLGGSLAGAGVFGLLLLRDTVFDGLSPAVNPASRATPTSPRGDWTPGRGAAAGVAGYLACFLAVTAGVGLLGGYASAYRKPPVNNSLYDHAASTHWLTARRSGLLLERYSRFPSGFPTRFPARPAATLRTRPGLPRP